MAKVRITNTIDAWFEWSPSAADEARCQAVHGCAPSALPPLTATELRALLDEGQGLAPQPNDRAYETLTGSPAPDLATEGDNMLWLARKASGTVVYG